MSAICLLVALCLPACGLAQAVAGGFGGGSFSSGSSGGSSSMSGYGPIPGRPAGIGNLQASLRIDGPSYSFPLGIVSSVHGRSSSGDSYFSRALIDPTMHVYFGYELILEEQQPGTFLATFGKLALTPFEAAASSGSRWQEWSMQAIPALPDPKVVHNGDMISIELMTAANGEKLIDDIEIRPFAPLARSPLPLNIGSAAVRSLSLWAKTPSKWSA